MNTWPAVSEKSNHRASALSPPGAIPISAFYKGEHQSKTAILADLRVRNALDEKGDFAPFSRGV